MINDLIFKELIKRGYSLEGKTRVWNIADSKLWYLTKDQSQAFLDLEQEKDYQKNVIQKEIDLMELHISNILKEVGNKPVNIIDLGCGDGKKAALFIKYMGERARIRYCPIDISNYMIERALENVRALNVGEVVEFQWNVSDFENLGNIANLLRRGKFKHNFILLLGNTLGNFEINELLYTVRSSMSDGDFLLIGNGLDNRKRDDILKTYSGGLLDELLSKTLEQIEIKKADIEYGARFRNSRVEMFYTIKRDFSVSFLDKKVDFAKGDQIIVASSYKYDEESFRSYMKLYFDDTKVYITKDKSYALALCRK